DGQPLLRDRRGDEPGGGGRRGRSGERHVPEDEDDRHRHGRQRRNRGAGRDHRSVRLRRVLGRTDHRRGGWRDRRLRGVGDREGPRPPGRPPSPPGVAGRWGPLAFGLFTSPRLAELNAVGDGGLWYQLTKDNVPGGTFEQLGDQALGIIVAFGCVFTVSYIVFALIKATIGLRVSRGQEERR